MTRTPSSRTLIVLILILTPLALAGCGEAAQLLEKTQGLAAQIGSIASKVSSTSEAVSETAGVWGEATQGPPGERTITELDFSGLTLTLQGCSLSGSYLECGFTAELSTSVPNKQIRLSISRALTPDGIELKPSLTALGGTDNGYSDYVQHSLIGGVPAAGKVVFGNVAPDTTELRVVEVTVDSRTLHFQNVRVAVK